MAEVSDVAGAYSAMHAAAVSAFKGGTPVPTQRTAPEVLKVQAAFAECMKTGARDKDDSAEAYEYVTALENNKQVKTYSDETFFIRRWGYKISNIFSRLFNGKTRYINISLLPPPVEEASTLTEAGVHTMDEANDFWKAVSKLDFKGARKVAYCIYKDQFGRYGLIMKGPNGIAGTRRGEFTITKRKTALDTKLERVSSVGNVYTSSSDEVGIITLGAENLEDSIRKIAIKGGFVPLRRGDSDIDVYDSSRIEDLKKSLQSLP